MAILSFNTYVIDHIPQNSCPPEISRKFWRVRQVNQRVNSCCMLATLARSLTVVPRPRALGVTQNSIYFPKASRVCASMAGIDPQIIEISGTKNHCANMEAVLVHR